MDVLNTEYVNPFHTNFDDACLLNLNSLQEEIQAAGGKISKEIFTFPTSSTVSTIVATASYKVCIHLPTMSFL